jgi:hypothetical protein
MRHWNATLTMVSWIQFSWDVTSSKDDTALENISNPVCDEVVLFIQLEIDRL